MPQVKGVTVSQLKSNIWNPRMQVWKMIFLFKQCDFRVPAVNFSGCIFPPKKSTLKNIWVNFNSAKGEPLNYWGVDDIYIFTLVGKRCSFNFNFLIRKKKASNKYFVPFIFSLKGEQVVPVHGPVNVDPKVVLIFHKPLDRPPRPEINHALRVGGGLVLCFVCVFFFHFEKAQQTF